jgi:glycosyltransferase involved in cell wall biosynthesis
MMAAGQAQAYKLVVLAYEFPPFVSIAAQRPASWYRYLPEYGIHPVVVTRHWDDEVSNPADYLKASSQTVLEAASDGARTVFRVPHKPALRDRMYLSQHARKLAPLRKVLTAAHQVLDYRTLVLDRDAGLYRAACAAIEQHGADAILASGGPFILFRYAALLSKRYRIPWVADYRDGWSSNEGNKEGAALNRLLFRRVEQRITTTARMRLAASPTYAKRIEQEVDAGSVRVLLNGFDPETIPDPKLRPQGEAFTIAYGGTIYPHQPLEAFADAVHAVAQQLSDATPIRAVFYGGSFFAEQEQRIRRAFSGKAVELVITQRLPHGEALAKLAQADALLLLTHPDYAWLYAKVFDYLALQKPLVVYRNDCGIIEEVLQEAGVPAGCQDKDALKARILTLYQDWQEGRLEQQDYRIDRFSRKAQTGRLADLLKLGVFRSTRSA